MYKFFLLVFSIFASPVLALETHTSSSQIAQNGLAKTVASLAAQPVLAPDDLFALGGLQFLRSVELTLQTRWQSNAVMEDIDIPVLRLPIAPNPDAIPFEPSLVANLFEQLRADLDTTRATLSAIPVDAELGVTLDLADIWFDVNLDGTRGEDEGLFAIGRVSLQTQRFGEPVQTPETLLVRFDTADLPWLVAYTHLLSGIGELVGAFDPTAAITLVMDSNAKMDELRGQTGFANPYDAGFGKFVDIFAMVYLSLNTKPDADRTQAAHGHFLSMIAENKKFWALLALETDNQAEWIPNGTQTAALGFELPDDAGAVWQSILNDAEALLKGEKLIPYWRISPAGGVNVARLFQDPPDVNIVTWVQGAGLLPYLDKGPTVDMTNVRMFEQMISGDAMMFAILFN